MCYMIQTSNGLYYHLMLRFIRGDTNIKPFNLNNGRYTRDVCTDEMSCMHAFCGCGTITTEYIKDVLQLLNPGFPREEMLRTIDFMMMTSAQAGFEALNKAVKRYAPGFIDIEVFDELLEKTPFPKLTGDFSEKIRNKSTGKHTLLLVGVREKTADDIPDGGGYFGIFQNTWKNRPIWLELGFDLLRSMGGIVYFINDELPFDNQRPPDIDYSEVLAMSSMSSPPPFAICERVGGDHEEDSETGGDSSDIETPSVDVCHELPSAFQFDPPTDGIYIIE